MTTEQLPTREDVIGYLKDRRNWGRWGADDQRGAINLITPEKRVRAAQLVKSGRLVSLSRDFPTVPHRGNPMPAQHFRDRRPRTTGCGHDYRPPSALIPLFPFHWIAVTIGLAITRGLRSAECRHIIHAPLHHHNVRTARRSTAKASLPWLPCLERNKSVRSVRCSSGRTVTLGTRAWSNSQMGRMIRKIAWYSVFVTGAGCFLASLPIGYLVDAIVGAVLMGISFLNLGVLNLFEKIWPDLVPPEHQDNSDIMVG